MAEHDNKPEPQSLVVKKRYRITRDSILFVAGLTGAGHETFFSVTERPFLLGLFGAMMGMPFFIRMDEKRRDGGGGA